MPRLLLAASYIVAALLAGPVAAQDVANPLQAEGAWPDLAPDILGDTVPLVADGVLDLEAPMRAEDAATVPIRLHQPEGAPTIAGLILVVDENPSPVAAEIVFGDAMMPLDLEVRLRVNQYSNVRAIATTGLGDVVMGGRFVKASGGCSAPASSGGEEALAAMGEMRLREFETGPDGRREAQVMIRHPQFSGFQRDQLTQLRVPAHFIDRLEIYQGDQMLFTLTGGISLSENPVFRFRYTDNGSAGFRVMVRDTEGLVFEQTLPKDAPA